MFLYPLVYVVLTLPNASGRMYSMANPTQKLPVAFYIAAGSLFTSCGWVDSILYAATRRLLVRPDMDSLRHYHNGRSTRNMNNPREMNANVNNGSDTGASDVKNPVSHNVTITASRRKPTFSGFCPLRYDLFRSRKPNQAPVTLNTSSFMHGESNNNGLSFASRLWMLVSQRKRNEKIAEGSDCISESYDVVTKTTIEVTVERSNNNKDDLIECEAAK